VSTQVSELAARRREVLARLGHPDPDAPHVGRILPWRVDGSTVSLRTELDGLGTFTETVTLHGPDGEPIALDVADPAVLGALDVAALTVAVSYLKATLPARIEVHVGPGDGGPGDGGPGDGHHTRHSARLAMLRSLLGPGLAELAFHAGVGPLEGTFELVVVEAPVGADATGGPGGHAPRTAHWWRPGDRPAVARSSGVAHRAQGTHGTHGGHDGRDGHDTHGGHGDVRPGVLVTVGGGKDSALTLALAHEHAPDALAFAVNPRAPMERTAAWAEVPLVRMTRRIDRALLDLNARGAINGHVPITAIVTSLAALAAAALGRGTVLVSNEGSADEPTRVVDGWRINHQHSKSRAFELLLDAALAEAGAGVRVVSLLRPFGELAIAIGVARRPGLIAQVTSCNAAFAMDGPGDGWCGRCPKCRFVQLALAPFVARTELVAALGFDALDDASQITGFAEMLDAATKPFECVGTVEEVRLALDLLAARGSWRDTAVVRALGRSDVTDLDARLTEALRPEPVAMPPAPFDRWLEDVGDPAHATEHAQHGGRA
jgi:hypothetical protein